ncbi:MAG TPA: ABC transporter permease [Ktedonobacteraceae bacterium]|nr:ABC transporter permease [Ktedonobacteraceae bacterium]
MSDNENTVVHNSTDMIIPSRSRSKTRYNLLLIIKREYMTRLQLQSFQIVTLVLMVIAIIGASIPTILAVLTARAQTQMVIINTAGKIGYLDDRALLAFLNVNLNAGYSSQPNSAAITPADKAHFALRMASAGEIDALRQQVRDSKLSILLQIARTRSGELQFIYYTNEPLSQNSDLAQMQTVAAQLHVQDGLNRLGIAQNMTTSLFAPPALEAISTLQEQSGRSPTESNVAIFMAMFIIVLLYMFIQQYCNMVAAGVAEEKSSRIMEILINATTPFQLLLGKIIGIGLVGVSQMGLVCLVGSAALLLQNPLQKMLHIEASSSIALPDITAISLGMLGMMVIYFVLGYLLYATLYAAAGSLVSRQEEVASSVGPIAFLIMAGYLASFYVTFNPRADWIVPLSYVPFFTPMMMLAREALAPLPWWEIALSGVLMVAAILALTWLAASVYRIGVLMYGQKPSFDSFLRYIRVARNTGYGKDGKI